MSGYWITGVIPLYATALLPMFAGPIMGLQTSGTLSREYLPVSGSMLDNFDLTSVLLENPALYKNFYFLLHINVKLTHIYCFIILAKHVQFEATFKTNLLNNACKYFEIYRMYNATMFQMCAPSFKLN